MKMFVLAVMAALTIGMGSAYAHQTVYHNGVEIWGPADTTGAGSGG